MDETVLTPGVCVLPASVADGVARSEAVSRTLEVPVEEAAPIRLSLAQSQQQPPSGNASAKTRARMAIDGSVPSRCPRRPRGFCICVCSAGNPVDPVSFLLRPRPVTSRSGHAISARRIGSCRSASGGALSLASRLPRTTPNGGDLRPGRIERSHVRARNGNRRGLPGVAMPVHPGYAIFGEAHIGSDDPRRSDIEFDANTKNAPEH
jgi:hypothetical protein